MDGRGCVDDARVADHDAIVPPPVSHAKFPWVIQVARTMFVSWILSFKGLTCRATTSTPVPGNAMQSSDMLVHACTFAKVASGKFIHVCRTEADQSLHHRGPRCVLRPRSRGLVIHGSSVFADPEDLNSNLQLPGARTVNGAHFIAFGREAQACRVSALL